jgi:hypothetical protein
MQWNADKAWVDRKHVFVCRSRALPGAPLPILRRLSGPRQRPAVPGSGGAGRTRTGESREAQGVRFSLIADDRIIQLLSWNQVHPEEEAVAAL